MRKNVIQPYKAIDAGDMSGDITQSPPTDAIYLDNMCYHIVWSGSSPVGEIKVQVTNDDYDKTGVVPTWTDLDFGTTIGISGSSGSHILSVNQYPGKWVRIKYIRTSGSGTLNVKLVAKQIGG